MPMYVYKCKKCNHEAEKIESYSASSIQACPNCLEAETFIRELAPSSFILSGNGWCKDSYQTRT